MSDSWDSFAAMLLDESVTLRKTHEAALGLSKALVKSDATMILSAERALDQARREYHAASGKRRGMQIRGFGSMTLRQVCAYAPRPMWPILNQRIVELTTTSIGLQMTNNNNKALISAGMQRLMKITAALQKAANNGPRTYKRRGHVPPPTNSVLVSSKA
jgi:flagellar biosynthesis/type III secretory pathway chaperone